MHLLFESKDLKEALGHSSLDMTMRYSHLAPDSMLEVLQKNPALMLFYFRQKKAR